jgi:hypothetical protein
MKNKHYAPGNKKPNKAKNRNREICIEDVPDFYFNCGIGTRSRRAIQIPYLLNHRTNVTKNRFN